MNLHPEGTEALEEAFTSLSRHATPGNHCPEPEALWAGAHGERPGTETRELIEHTATCPSCAEAWRLAVELGRAASRRAAPRPVLSRGSWSRWGPVAAAAAALVLVVVGLRTTDLLRPGPEPVVRGTRAGEIRSLVSAEPLPRTACRLAWSELTEVLHYDLLVTSEELEIVAQVEGLTDPEYLVPEADLADLPVAARLLWRVEAVLEDGERRSSETFISRLE